MESDISSSARTPMLPHVHDHIGRELHQVARTDTVFIVVATVFNLIVLSINWNVGGAINETTGLGQHLMFWILIGGTLIITITAARALTASSATRLALIAGLVRLYADEGIDRYYDGAVAQNYAARSVVFRTILAVLGGFAVVVPLIAYLT
jgi:hypothetical protein